MSRIVMILAAAVLMTGLIFFMEEPKATQSGTSIEQAQAQVPLASESLTAAKGIDPIAEGHGNCPDTVDVDGDGACDNEDTCEKHNDPEYACESGLKSLGTRPSP